MAFKVTSTYNGKTDHSAWIDADSAEDFRIKYAITPFVQENYDPWSWQYFMAGNEDYAADADNIERQRQRHNQTFDPINQIYTVEHIYDSEGSYEHIKSIINERIQTISNLANQYSQGLFSDSETNEFNLMTDFRVEMYTKRLVIDSDYSV